MSKKPKEIVRKVYSLLLAYINSEVSDQVVGTENSDWLAQGEGDIGTIAIRTNLSLDKLVKDAAEYAYLELKFSTQTQKTTPMTPEIGKLRTSYHGENYSVVISRKNLAAPYFIRISKSM